MAKQGVGLGEVINEFMALGRAHLAFLAVTTLAIAAGYSALDLVTRDAGSAVSGLVVGIFVQLVVVERLLSDRLPGGKAQSRRYGAVFSAAIIGGIGIILGLVAFVVPGLILMAAWSASTPFIVVDGLSGPKALAASWRATRGSRVALTLAMAIGCLAFAVMLLLLMAAVYALAGVEAIEQEGNLAVTIPANLLASAFSVGGWILAATAYRLVRPANEMIEEVFA